MPRKKKVMPVTQHDKSARPASAALNERGHEVPDETPVNLPLKFRRTENIIEQTRRIVREEMSRAAELEGYGSFEDEDDFEVGDDYDPTSPYEMDYDQEIYDGSGNESGGGGETPPSSGGAPGDEKPIQSAGKEDQEHGTSDQRVLPGDGPKPRPAGGGSAQK